MVVGLAVVVVESVVVVVGLAVVVVVVVELVVDEVGPGIEGALDDVLELVGGAWTPIVTVARLPAAKKQRLWATTAEVAGSRV